MKRKIKTHIEKHHSVTNTFRQASTSDVATVQNG